MSSRSDRKLTIIGFDNLQCGGNFSRRRRGKDTGWSERALLSGEEFEGVGWRERAEVDEGSEGGF
jgi:hypothetical protein